MAKNHQPDCHVKLWREQLVSVPTVPTGRPREYVFRMAQKAAAIPSASEMQTLKIYFQHQNMEIFRDHSTVLSNSQLKDCLLKFANILILLSTPRIIDLNNEIV